MQKLKLIPIISFLISIPLLSVAADNKQAVVPQNFYNVKFVKNYDGDTFTVNLRCRAKIFCKSMSVRIKGIDAPEIKGKTECEREMAQKAKLFVFEALNKAKPLTLTNCTKDKYFRINCDVIFNEESNLAQQLLDKKLVIAYDGGTKQPIDWCLFQNRKPK